MKKNFLGYLIKNLMLNKKMLFLTVFISLLAVILGQLVPVLNSFLVDTSIVPASTQYLWLFMIAIVVILLLEAICIFLYHVLFHNFGYETAKNLKLFIVSKLLYRNYSYFETEQRGGLISKLSAYTKDVGEYITKDLSSLIVNGLRLIIVLFYMIGLNYILGLILAAIYILLGALIFFVSKVIKKRTYSAKQTETEINAALHEYVEGFSVMQVYNRSFKTLNNYDKAVANHTPRRKKLYYLYLGFNPLMDFLTSITTIIVYFFAFYFFSNGAIELGVIVAFLGYAFDSTTPIRNVTDAMSTLQFTTGIGERLVEMIGEDTIVKGKGELKKNFDIEFKGVTYKHPFKGNVLKNINIKIPYGEHVLIFGPHGSGKSTLALMILGLYQPKNGKILIGNKNIKFISKENISKNIGYIGDNPYIFNGTVAENVKYANFEVSADIVLQALEKSGLMESLRQNNKNEKTALGGLFQLSASEKIMLGFARILVKDPRVLILDDSFTFTKEEVRLNIESLVEELFKDKTLIYISGNKNTKLIFSQALKLKKGYLEDEKNN